ncbi:ABC transporter permease [Mucilaginibacter myungsuensis]|uniref:ABC transporter permease n=1 Tax=Mucilaginibacter myungsuensis TaxID=649104 RepID=A0A929PY02_9SPHI|nr:ABC transporter permease [Mucilaginibacter myungsuensis]MBE9662812.1 ABC transporter permease [Mucilaginibacter myungsuensis]MDN3598232.1 ABC transporter permease [Mucilaginibacter myungsuensis]
MYFYLTALLLGLSFGCLAFGIYISMKIFNIPDITTDGSYTLGGAVTGVMLIHDQPTYIILPSVIAAGAVAGALTGIIHTKLKINALLAGILVMTALYSVNLAVMGRSNLPLINLPTLFSLISFSSNTDINAFWILSAFVVIIIAIIGYLLKTDLGLAMRATGNSESMVRALGVDTDRMKILGLAIANALTALSGYQITQYQGFADISMGIGVVITGLGSVIIAETVINWLHITFVWASLALVLGGAVIFQLVLALTLSLGVDANYLKAATAIFVLLIVGLPRLTRRAA